MIGLLAASNIWKVLEKSPSSLRIFNIFPGEGPWTSPFPITRGIPFPSGPLIWKGELKIQSWLSHCKHHLVCLEESGSPLCKPRVCREGSDSISLLGRPRCEICQQNPCNTCLMHHQSRHTDLCYSCAASHFAKGHLCPLCPNKIVYIYMYDDL